MGVAAPGDIFTGGGLPYLKSEGKERIWKQGLPLAIVKAVPKADNQFGDTETRFIVTGKALNGEEHVLALSHNEVRERQAEQVADLLARGSSAVGPVYLVKVKSKAGKVAWALAPDAQDPSGWDAMENPSGKPAASASTASDNGDDDIPF